MSQSVQLCPFRRYDHERNRRFGNHSPSVERNWRYWTSPKVFEQPQCHLESDTCYSHGQRDIPFQILSSQTSILESTLLSAHQSKAIDRPWIGQYCSSPSRYKEAAKETPVSIPLSDTGPLRMMVATTTYDLLWSHQLLLLREIDSLNSQIVAIRHTLDHSEQVLSQFNAPRRERKKSQWAHSTARHSLRDREQDVRVLLRNLAVCQAQIAAAHGTAYSMIGASNPASMPAMQNAGYQLRGRAWSSVGGSPQMAYQNGVQQVWDPSCTPDGPTTPVIQPNYPTIDARLTRPPPTEPRRPSRDSGFFEPPLFAHPFDLDTTSDTGNHVFTHEMMGLPQLNTVPIDSPTSNAALMSAISPRDTSNLAARLREATLSTTASVPAPASTSSSAPVLGPTAAAFTSLTPSFSAPSTQSAFTPAKKTLTFAPSVNDPPQRIHRNPTFASLSPILPSPQPTSLTPVPVARHQRRYSEAAISLIENRMREKAIKHQQTQTHSYASGIDIGGAGVVGRGNGVGVGGDSAKVYRRRGKSIADVAVQMWYRTPNGADLVEEMVWPLTA